MIIREKRPQRAPGPRQSLDFLSLAWNPSTFAQQRRLVSWLPLGIAWPFLQMSSAGIMHNILAAFSYLWQRQHGSAEGGRSKCLRCCLVVPVYLVDLGAFVCPSPDVKGSECTPRCPDRRTGIGRLLARENRQLWALDTRPTGRTGSTGT